MGRIRRLICGSAQSLYPIDNGDGTFSVGASFSDFGLRLIDAGPYTSQAQAVAAIETHLGTNLTTTF
jgi:hypothetical protein